MDLHLKFKKSNTFIYITLLVFLFGACSSDDKEKKLQASLEDSISANAKLLEDFNKAKQVFYSLPSPIETAMLIKRSGAKFNESLINPLSNLSNYVSTRSKALNFGVYGADLSYASLFDQTQTTVKYLSATKNLAEQLGILDIIQRPIVERLEKNINNRDSTMEIITETFMNSNSFLKENGRPEVAALTIAGGWIEGLYIATQLTKATPKNNELIDRIIDQKLSLITLVKLMEEYKTNEDVAIVLADINQIKAVYDKIQMVSSKIEPVTNKEKHVTTLNAKTDIFVNDEIFNELMLKVEEIRKKTIL